MDVPTGQVHAEILTTKDQVDQAEPGIYVIRSTSEAYFPALAHIEANYARLVGQYFEDDNVTVITMHVVTLPPKGARSTLGESFGLETTAAPERRAITIGREFFLTALKDYKDWHVKWWREAIQNSVDAGATKIDLVAVKSDDEKNWLFSVEDNGTGMTAEVLVDKFLVLGATTKVGAAGAAGGFGKAKELLLLPWVSWRIHSNDTLAEGAGIDYDVSRVAPRRGTKLEVVMPDDMCTRESAAISFVEKCYLPHIKFTINGRSLKADLDARDLIGSVEGKADIFFTPAKYKQPYMYIRTRGLFMFQTYVTEMPGVVVVELTAPSIEILTANRDGFRDWQTSHEIEKFTNRIAKDTMSALRSKQGLIRQKFEGAGKFKAQRIASSILEQIGPLVKDQIASSDEKQVLEIIDHYRGEEAANAQSTSLPSSESAAAMLDITFIGSNHTAAALKQLVWQPDFFIINEREGFKVPKKFFPETMTPRVLKLAKTWVEFVRFVMMQLGSEQHFGVGWVFSSSAAAMAVTEADKNGDNENWILLNPFKNMMDGELWRPSHDPDLKWLYAAAVHEATHISDGISYHDESFASALTMNIAKTADGFRKIRRIVSGIRMQGSAEADVLDGYFDPDDFDY